MTTGPLAVRWGTAPRLAPEAGTIVSPEVTVENAGSVTWQPGISIASHWLDLRGNPIVWDGPRNPAPPLAPGERATVPVRIRVPIPPGRYRLAFDVVAEFRAWLSELGSEMLTVDVDVGPRTGQPSAPPTAGYERAPSWEPLVRAAHAEGYGVVAGAIDWPRRLFRRRPPELDAYVPGQGRVPGFAAPLLAPSVLPGIELEQVGETAGLPAFAAPADEPWLYDGRIVLRRV